MNIKSLRVNNAPIVKIQLIGLFLCALFVSACAISSSKDDTPVSHQLRIANIGAVDILDLTLLFPGATSYEVVKVAFGDVPAGEMSAYQTVPGGVYRYAAYEYSLAGRITNQSVVDWLGESPLQGEWFTYRLELQVGNVPGDQVELVDIVVDVP